MPADGASGMHDSSYNHMKDLAGRYLDPGRSMQILDVGSLDVNGSYRPIFEKSQWKYRGLDLSPGNNVDIVLTSPYKFPVKSGSIDLVISGQSFEHIEFFWLTWLEMVRVLKPEGMIFLIAPSTGSQHRYPVDCWRFYPDGFRALAKLGGVETLEVTTDWKLHPDPEDRQWGDTVGVFRKPRRSATAVLMRQAEHMILHRLASWIVQRDR